MHHASGRRGAVVGLCFLLALPALTLFAADLSPLARLRADGTVFLNGDAVRAESVLYAGDQVRTAEGRASLTLARGTLVVLSANSGAVVRRTSGDPSIALEKGRIAVSFADQAPPRIDADGLQLTPTGNFPALAEVAMLGDGSLTVAVHRGNLSIAELRDAPVRVAAGQIITISPRLAQADKSKPIGTGAHGKMTLGEKLRTFHIGSLSHNASVAIMVGAIGGGTATAIAVPLAVGDEASPSAP